MQPSNFAARVGKWSATHRRTAILGWILFVVLAVVVGGAAITGGRGTLIGTLIGVALLGTIGTALTFAGINPFWEKAIQGAIILLALSSEIVFGKLGALRKAAATR